MTAESLNPTTYNNVAGNTVNGAVLDAAAILAWRQDVKTVVDQHATEINSMASEVGGNANGYYLKLGDGTMICWYNATNYMTVEAGLTGQSIRPFPATFISVPSVTLTALYDTSFLISVYLKEVTVTDARISLYNGNQNDLQLGLHYIAIGRWK